MQKYITSRQRGVHLHPLTPPKSATAKAWAYIMSHCIQEAVTASVSFIFNSPLSS